MQINIQRDTNTASYAATVQMTLSDFGGHFRCLNFYTSENLACITGTETRLRKNRKAIVACNFSCRI